VPVRLISGGWGDGRSYFGEGVVGGFSFIGVGEEVGPPSPGSPTPTGHRFLNNCSAGTPQEAVSV